MIEGALTELAAGQTEMMEVGMKLAFYIGMLSARAFMHIANTVFRSPEFAPPEDERR